MVGFLLHGVLLSQIPRLNYILDVQIIDASSKKPLVGADVLLLETGNRAFPNEHGEFHFHLPQGRYQLRSYHMGYDVLLSPIELLDDTSIVLMLTPKPFHLEEVQILSSVIENTAGRTTMNTKVIDRNYLERNYHSTFSQGLEKMPGMNSITTGVGIAKPVIRGFTGNRVTVNNQGIRQEGQQWGSDHGLEIDPYLVDRIEVIRGAASLIYGSDAMGGVINVLEPTINPKGSYESSVLGVYRGNNDHFGTSAAFSGRPNDWHFSARATVQTYGDYRVPADNFTYNGFVLPIEGERLKNTAGRERHLAASVGRLMPRGSVRLSVSNYYQRTGLFPGAVGIPRSFVLLHDGDHRNVDIPLQELDHFKAVMNSKYRVGRGRVETDLGFQRNHRREKSSPHAHGQGPRPEGNLAHGLLLNTGTINSRYHLTFNERWKTIAGINAQYQTNERSGFEFLLGDYQSIQAGIFAMAEYMPNEKLTYSFGLRQDVAAIDIKPHFIPVYASPTEIVGQVQRGPEASRRFGQPSGAAGLSWNPSQMWNLKANVGRSFRFPSPPELGMNGIHHGTFRHEMGDPTLQSERGWQLDAGLYHNRQRWNVSLTPFANYFDNFIFLRPTAQFSPLPEAGQMFIYTEARAFHTGAELQAAWDIHPKLVLEGSLEYTYNYNLDSGLPIPFTPPLLQRTELSYYLKREPDHDVYFFAEAVLSAAQNLTELNEPATPGYQLYNVGFQASKPFGKYALHLQFMVRNIGDTFYLNHLSRYRLLNLPEPGRNVMLSLRLTRKD